MHFQHIKNLQFPFDMDEKEEKKLFGKGTKKLIQIHNSCMQQGQLCTWAES